MLKHLGKPSFWVLGTCANGTECEANVVVFGVVVVAVALALAVGVAVAVLVVIVVVAVAVIVIVIVMVIVTVRSVVGVIVIGVVTVVVVVGGIVVSVSCCMCGECMNVAPNFSSRPEGGRLRKKDGANFSNSEKSHSDTLLA